MAQFREDPDCFDLVAARHVPMLQNAIMPPAVHEVIKSSAALTRAGLVNLATNSLERAKKYTSVGITIGSTSAPTKKVRASGNSPDQCLAISLLKVLTP